MILKEREIKNFSEIEEIINAAEVCYVGMVDVDKPYVLPYNFGYENNTFYLHGASEGKKVEVLNKNNNVCITISIDHKLSFRHETVACSYSMKYKSIVASGKAISIDDYDEKCRCLNLIMKKYVKKEFKFNPPSINNIKIFKIEIENITGKKF